MESPSGSHSTTDADAARRAAIEEVFSLQRALDEINKKIMSTQGENASLAKENDELSVYIDSLMSNVSSMGSRITADKSKSKGQGASSLFGKNRKSVTVNGQVGELTNKPRAQQRPASVCCGGAVGSSASAQRPASVCCGGAAGSSAPIRLPTSAAGGANAPMRLGGSVPPPPPPPPARDPATGRFGVGGVPPPPPPPRLSS